MFLRSPFAEQDKQKIVAFVQHQPFATLVSSDACGVPMASHLPVDIVPEQNASFGIKLISHMANGNPHLPLLSSGNEVLIIFLSNNHYISPSWFENKTSAPTQTHIAVHAYGKAKVISDPQKLFELMKHQVKSRESQIGQSWSMDDLGEQGIQSRLSQISGIEINIERVEASFRLLHDESQEKVQGVLNNAQLSDGIEAAIRAKNDLEAETAQ